MMKWWKRLVKDHKGFSLVELICTIAIFSIIVTSVGTAMVVSARSYQSGNVELDLQQQAQITSNLLTNLIIDSDRVVQASGETLIVEKVESGVVVTYQIYYDEAADIIYYKTSADTTGTPRILAEHVTGFTVSQDTGSNVDFKLEFEENSRSYESDYHVTPRNGVTSGGAAMSGTASLFVENHLILEPGQEYDLNVRVLGTSIQGFTIENLSGCTDTTGTTVQALDTSTVRINVGLGETNSEFHFDVKALDGSIAPQPVTVFVRRVNAINVSGYMVSGTAYKADAEYKVVATLSGTNLDREPGAWFDVDYVNPYTVDWSFDSGFEEINRGTDGNFPYIILKLKQDMAMGDSLKVTATALHPEGKYPADSDNKTNKSGLRYDTVSGFWELKKSKIIKISGLQRTGKVNLSIDEDMLPEEFFGEVYHYEEWKDGVYTPAYTSYGPTYDVETVKLYFLSQVDPAYPSSGIDGYTRAIDYTVTSKWSQYGSYINLTHVGGDESYLNWVGTLSPQRTGGNSEQFAFSSPYFEAWNEYAGWWCDINEVIVKYTFKLASGEMVEVVESADLEEVAIEYRNSVEETRWSNAKKVFLTKEDCVDGSYTHRAYFRFIQGWDKDITAEDWKPYYFHKLNRFVGVVHDGKIDGDPNIRNDITATISSIDALGNSYVEFKVREDQIVAGQIVQEIFEYNPYFATTACPTGTTPDLLNEIEGCEGIIKFCFVEPNVYDYPSKPKITYCPTLADLESSDTAAIYYIDDDTRYVIQQTQAEYQIKDATTGIWISNLTLKWDSRNGKTGWFCE